jgi:hypothetical protein
MLYEVDSFGFVPGFVSKGVKLMSEEDLKADDNLRKEFEETKYLVWKRHNIADLIEEYDRTFKSYGLFETFCKRIYQDVLEKEKESGSDSSHFQK